MEPTAHTPDHSLPFHHSFITFPIGWEGYQPFNLEQTGNFLGQKAQWKRVRVDVGDPQKISWQLPQQLCPSKPIM
jgi:hypothetical protein